MDECFVEDGGESEEWCRGIDGYGGDNMSESVQNEE